MSKITNIQWCDSKVNPIMGCGGGELFPPPSEVFSAIDAATQAAGVLLDIPSRGPPIDPLLACGCDRFCKRDKLEHLNTWIFERPLKSYASISTTIFQK